MSSNGNFNNSYIDTVNNITAKNYIRYEGATIGPLEKLLPWITPEAMYDADARSDAPKCHPETRVAVQDEMYSWVAYRDRALASKKAKWITGPAGTGKTAIAGSLAKRFDEEGLLAASFFFSAFSPHAGQKTKRSLIPTLAFQLAEKDEAFKQALGRAIQSNPVVFKKNLQAQVDALILQPLRDARMQRGEDASPLPPVIIVDGIDECTVDELLQQSSLINPTLSQKRLKEADQLEVLQVLLNLAAHELSPFRIILVSRPEPVFCSFFEPLANSSILAPNLVLDEKYNPDADITLFLEAKFAEIRYTYRLPESWPTLQIIRRIVEKASGQFVYAATIIRFILIERRENPQIVLESALTSMIETPQVESPVLRGEGSDNGSEAEELNTFIHLDALYTHIIQSSPKPELAVQWLWAINGDFYRTWSGPSARPPARFINKWLQKAEGDAEFLLGNLRSLVNSPNPQDKHATYEFYHKSLFDYLGNKSRSGSLHVAPQDRREFIIERYLNACSQQGAQFREGDSAELLDEFFCFDPQGAFTSVGDPAPWLLPQPCVDWWIREHISRKFEAPISFIFSTIHYKKCRWFKCHPACKLWRYSIIRQCSEAGWKGVPRKQQMPFCHSVKIWTISQD